MHRCTALLDAWLPVDIFRWKLSGGEKSPRNVHGNIPIPTIEAIYILLNLACNTHDDRSLYSAVALPIRSWLCRALYRLNVFLCLRAAAAHQMYKRRLAVRWTRPIPVSIFDHPFFVLHGVNRCGIWTQFSTPLVFWVAKLTKNKKLSYRRETALQPV